MPRGGQRPGAGRPTGHTMSITPKRMAPPKTLPLEAVARWRAWSPLALRAGTLCRQTAPAFELLCTAAADLEALRRARAKDVVAIAQLSRLVYDAFRDFQITPADRIAPAV